LCDAYKNIELANLYLNFVFDFLNDKSKYIPNTELGNRRETVNLIAAINSAETQEIQQIEVEPR
jgi:transcriptional antiterminator Rof (Rho-off)